MSFDKIGLYDNNYIILDTETTGLSKNDEVIELGIIDCDGNILYESLFNPGYDIDDEIMRITGIKNGDLYDAPCFNDEWNIIKNIITGKQIIGHNIGFDARLIQQTLDIHKIQCDFKDIFEEKIDTRKIAKSLLNVQNYAQENLARALNVKRYQAHRAVNDCLTLLEILKTLNSANGSVLSEAEDRMEEVLKERNPEYRRAKRAYNFKENRKNDILNLHEQGKTLSEIAKELGKSIKTIQENIVKFVSDGEIDYREFLSFDKEQLIINAIEEIGGFNGKISSIKQYLGNEVSYLEIILAVNNNDIRVVEENLIDEKLSLTALARKNNINRDELLDLFISKGLILDIKTITKKGEEHGIEYMYGDDDAKWPVYGNEVQQIIDASVFNFDYSSTNFNKNKKVTVSLLNGYKIFKHSASGYYFNGDMSQYANLTRKQIKDYLSKFKEDDCKTTYDDYLFLKKVIAAEADSKITRSEKYSLLGSTSYENFVSDEEKEKALKIVNDY